MENRVYSGNAHTFHNDIAAARYEAKKTNLMAAVEAPVSISKEKATELLKKLQSHDKAEQEIGNNWLIDAMQAPSDALAGKSNLHIERSKMVNSTVMPMYGKVIEVFISEFGDELTSLDVSYLSYLTTDILIGESRATIFDIVSNTTAYLLENDTDPITMSPYKGATWAGILPEHYGAGISVSRYIIESDPMTSLNNIITAIRVALLLKRTEVAFQRINAGIAAAIVAGYVTAYTASSVAETINVAYLDLIERNQARGYRLTGQTPTVLTGSERHRSRVESVFDITINSLINNSNGTIVSRYPITRQYSFYFEQDLGSSGSLMALMLPNRRLRMANFRGQRIESETKIDTNSQNTYGRESFQFLIDPEQIQIVTIA